MPKFIQLKKDIQRGKLKPLYILTGEERTVMNKYLHMITNCKYAEKVSNVIPLLRSNGLFSTTDVFVVKDDIDMITNDVKDIINNINHGTLILIYNKIDKRKKLFKTGKNYIYEFNVIKDSYIYVQQQLEVNTELAKLIADRCGNDIGKIDLEIEKIKLLNPKRITKDLINELIIPSPEDFMWDFIDGILKKDAKTVYNTYRDLKLLNFNEIQFLGILYNNFKAVLLIKGMSERSDYEIAKSTGLNLWLVGNCRKIVNRYFSKCTMGYVLEYLKAIQQLEVDIKLGKIDPELGFKCLINQFMRI